MSHLAQRQSADNLEFNLRMTKIAQANEIQLNEEVESKILRNSADLEVSIRNILIEHRDITRIALREMTDSITPYDVDDMKRFIAVQGKALNDTYSQIALLVSNNSELRMFLSFMPIRYREYVSKLKAESSVLYRQQRVSTKVIQTNDRLEVWKLNWSTPQWPTPTVQFALRDAEYATLGDARRKMEKGVALRKRISSDPSTRVIPRLPPPGDQPPPTFLQTTVANRYAFSPSKEARTKVVHDRRPLTQPAQLVTDSEDQHEDDHDE